MVQFTLPKNSKIGEGKTWPHPAKAKAEREFRIYRWSPDDGRQSAHRHLLRRHRRLRADGSRRADLDQEQHRPDADLPPLLPRRHLRLLLDEYRRHQHARLHQGDERGERRGAHLSAAAYAGGQGPGARPHQLLRPARLDQAVAADRVADAAEGVEAEPRRPAKARRPLRMHPVRLLLDLVPELLVECGPLSRPGGAVAGQPLDRRTRATRRPASGSTISRTRSGSIAATPS